MKEKLRMTSTVWDSLPERNRQQLMVILGEMAYNAVKSAHTGGRMNDENKTDELSLRPLFPFR